MNSLPKLQKNTCKKLGYGNQPFIIYKHEDINRHHIHIVSVKVDETGKMIRDNFQHRLSMRICRDLEQKYGLKPANEKQKSEGYSMKPVDPKKGNIKQQIANIVRPVSRSWHFQSFNEYKALLSIYNVQVSEVKGEHNGRPHNGIVYAALNDKGKFTEYPLNLQSLANRLEMMRFKNGLKNQKRQLEPTTSKKVQKQSFQKHWTRAKT